MDEKTWTVVQFLDDATVEAVPSIWIQGDVCHWPSLLASDRLMNAIKKCDPLNTCWPAHKVKIFRNATFDNYMSARLKAKVAEEKSDLSTDNEDRSRRKRIPTILSSSDESVTETLLGPAPKIKKYSKKSSVTSLRAEDKENVNLATTCSNIEDNDVTLQSTSRDDTLPVCQNCLEKDKTLKMLLQQGHILRGLISDTLHEVKEIRKELSISKQCTTVSSTNFFDSFDFTFPIESEENFFKVEQALQSEEKLMTTVAELSKLGGGNLYDLIRRILQLIMTNDFALKYSWLGRKGKLPFYKTNTAKLILKSAEATGLAQSQKEAEIGIQTWLRRASDRRNINRLNKKF